MYRCLRSCIRALLCLLKHCQTFPLIDKQGHFALRALGDSYTRRIIDHRAVLQNLYQPESRNRIVLYLFQPLLLFLRQLIQLGQPREKLIRRFNFILLWLLFDLLGCFSQVRFCSRNRTLCITQTRIIRLILCLSAVLQRPDKSHRLLKCRLIEFFLS